MGSKHLGGDVNLAWPTAQIAVMGAAGAVNILYRRELATADHPDELRRQRTTEYEDTLANPYAAAERGYIDAVIRPAETRTAVTRALTALRTKRETLPPKKHGNIPLLSPEVPQPLDSRAVRARWQEPRPYQARIVETKPPVYTNPGTGLPVG
jgi:hypothetical protein